KGSGGLSPKETQAMGRPFWPLPRLFYASRFLLAGLSRMRALLFRLCFLASLREQIHVDFINQRNASVYIPPEWREKIEGVVLLQVHRVVMNVVERFQAIESHGVGLLGYGGVNEAALDQIQGRFVRVHGDNQTIRSVVPAYRLSNVLTGGSLQTDKCIDVV